MHEVAAILTSLIRGVPGEIYGVLLGALVTLCAVILTNRAGAARLERQLTHEAKERRRAEEVALRRGVFLEAIEALERNQFLLARLADIEKPFEVDLGLEMLGPSARLRLIASLETSRCLVAANGSFARAFLSMAVSKMQVSALSAKRGSLEKAVADDSISVSRREEIRAYPKAPAARKVIQAQAKCSMAS